MTEITTFFQYSSDLINHALSYVCEKTYKMQGWPYNNFPIFIPPEPRKNSFINYICSIQINCKQYTSLHLRLTKTTGMPFSYLNKASARMIQLVQISLPWPSTLLQHIMCQHTDQGEKNKLFIYTEELEINRQLEGLITNFRLSLHK